MKKLLIATLVASFALTACQKPADKAVDSTEQTPTPQTNNTPTPPEQHAHDHHDHNHDHDEHAGHVHEHPEGDKYQCGDKTAHIVVHNHEGELEAHLTTDNITYDLDEDTKNKGRFVSDDSILGDDKGMALIIDGDKAKITTLDGQDVAECTKTI